MKENGGEARKTSKKNAIEEEVILQPCNKLVKQRQGQCEQKNLTDVQRHEESTVQIAVRTL